MPVFYERKPLLLIDIEMTIESIIIIGKEVLLVLIMTSNYYYCDYCVWTIRPDIIGYYWYCEYWLLLLLLLILTIVMGND